MKIEFDNEPAIANKIISYSNNAFKLKDALIKTNILISKDRLIEDWPVNSYQNLTLQDLDPIILWQPELIIIGTGKISGFPNPEMIAYAASKNIGLEIMNTSAACRSYNLLIGEGRDVVAGLFLLDN